ncbi:MAG: substrate-binding domain-containing protein, partial [Victivallales bacterium]|nr:substrate-binding domain-containing protein [Victivallales bacterium]
VIRNKCGNIPIVSYTWKIPYENSIRISSNKELSMSRLVSHLLAARHQKIAYITYENDAKNGERYKGFEKTMVNFECPINNSWIITDTSKRPEIPGYESTTKVIEKEPPTAIIYGSDQLAIGGMEAIKRAGLTIPNDISVVSFDDLPESATTFPPLTTMRLDMKTLATLLVESIEKLLLGRMHDKEVLVERELIQRESVAVRKK